MVGKAIIWRRTADGFLNFFVVSLIFQSTGNTLLQEEYNRKPQIYAEKCA
jgi:hypothetical protein